MTVSVALRILITGAPVNLFAAITQLGKVNDPEIGTAL
uniref:Uncharacterized protein n=1 Tax=Anguilla anguilla TaxID=7936 RepID=A0A0E9VMH4_ANGAN